MSESSAGLAKALKIGCFGCLGFAVVAVGVLAVMAGVAWRQAENETIAERELSHGLGQAAATDEDELESASVEVDAEDAIGTVILDLAQTTFEIRPGVPGEPARVRATFDVNTYELSEQYQHVGESGRWSYQVGFRRTSGSYLVAVLKELFSGSRPHLVIQLPPDVPFDLDLRTAQGGGEVELGGLWLTSADIGFVQGGGWIGFSEPLVQPIEHLGLDFRQGGGEIEGIGNASPETLDISFAMGGGDVDLTGAWQRDAEVSIEVKMGGASVWLPKNAEVRGIDRGRLPMPQSEEVQRPRLTISTSSRFGEVEFLD